MVPPGFSWPLRSASSIIRSPIRSLTLPPGLSVSTLARMVGRSPAVMRESRTSGVCPTASRMLPRTRTGPHLLRRIRPRSDERGDPARFRRQHAAGLGRPAPAGGRRAKDGEGDDAGAELALAGGAAAPTRPDVGGAEVKRIDCLKAIYPQLEDCAVVTIMGAVAAELYSLGHRANFFYLEHAMGLASSIGLGIALAQPKRRVLVIDGDGSVLMNLGGLTTLARSRPKNLVHVIFDNETLLSVGGGAPGGYKWFTTATAAGTDLAGIARAAGFPRAQMVRELGDFEEAALDAINRDQLSCIVAT